MVWLISISAVALVVVLAVVFVRNARAIRRDVDERFRHIQAELEDEANAVVRKLYDRRHEN